jgi:hypothetical protein
MHPACTRSDIPMLLQGGDAVSVAGESSDARVCTQHAKEDTNCEVASKPVEPVEKCGESNVDPGEEVDPGKESDPGEEVDPGQEVEHGEEVDPPMNGKWEDKFPSSCKSCKVVARVPDVAAESDKVVGAVKHKT